MATAAAAQLRRLGELRAQLAPVLSRNERMRIVAHNADLWPVLDLVFDTRQRFHVTSAGLARFLAHGTRVPADESPRTLEDLFRYLAAQPSRHAAALSTVVRFLERSGIVRDGRVADAHLYAVFARCIDRSLKCGISHKMLTSVCATASASASAAPRSTDTHIPYPFSVALGVAAPDIAAIDMAPPAWYASRKLDGVRCLIIAAEHGTRVLSRTGREHPGMQAIGHAVAAALGTCPRFAALRRSAPVVVDGEICVVADRSDGTFAENYAAALSAVRRKDGSATDLVYFPFDMLTYAEFCAWRTGSRPFSERIALLDAVIAECAPSPIRHLPQQRISSTQDILALQAHSAAHGWEGIMLRRDVPYEGRRSPAILKVKAWQDAEYTVEDIECRPMHLALGGQMAERHALSNIVVRHKGTRVSVGTGFSAAQRLHYAAHPEDIVGHVVTVAYFSESVPQHGAPSLRFPRIKAIFSSSRDT